MNSTQYGFKTLGLLRRALGCCLVIALTACSHAVLQDDFAVSAEQSIVLMPVTTYSQAPQAGEKVEVLLESIWYQRKLPALTVYPRNLAYADALPPLNDYTRFQNLQAWLAEQGADYYVTGSVSEWRYKSGLDGEPAVGLSLTINDARTGKVVWTAATARSGWDRESLTATAQKLISKQLNTLRLEKLSSAN